MFKWIDKLRQKRRIKKEIRFCAFMCANGYYQPSTYQKRVQEIKEANSCPAGEDNA